MQVARRHQLAHHQSRPYPSSLPVLFWHLQFIMLILHNMMRVMGGYQECTPAVFPCHAEQLLHLQVLCYVVGSLECTHSNTCCHGTGAGYEELQSQCLWLS